MTEFLIALGSNYDSARNIETAIKILSDEIGLLNVTPTLCTKAISIDAPDFTNALCYGSTSHSLDMLESICKSVEKRMHRTSIEKSQGIIRIDIDIMQYGKTRLHHDDWERDYIKTLLKHVQN